MDIISVRRRMTIHVSVHGRSTGDRSFAYTKLDGSFHAHDANRLNDSIAQVVIHGVSQTQQGPLSRPNCCRSSNYFLIIT